MSGGSKTQTTTNQTVISEEVKPLLSQYLSQAQTLSQQPGSNTLMDRGAAGASWQADNAYSGINAARSGLIDVAAGRGYDQNLYFDATVQTSMGDITRNY